MFKCNLWRWGLIALGSAVATVTSLAAPANPAPVSTNTDVIAALTAADKSLSQGIIVYSCKPTGKMFSQKIFSPTGKPFYHFDGKIIYLPDGRFEEDIKFPDKASSSVTYWDGENEISQAKEASKPANYGFVAINPTKPLELQPDTLPITVRPGPSFVLGRGLSLLKGLHVVSASSDAVTVTGTGGNASLPATVTAELEPHHDWLAKRIEIDFPSGQGNKTFPGVWTFGPSMKTASGQIIASSATYDIPEKGVRDYFVIRYANFARPTLSIPTSLPAGARVADTRLGRQILLFLPRALTLDQILVVTRRRAAQLAAQEAQDRAMEEARQRRGVVAYILMIVLAATVVAQLVIVWRRRKHPAGVA